MANVSFIITDLPGSQLGGALPNGTILIDVNAAGHGWYIDTTPSDDSEFDQQVVGSERRATQNQSAIDHADLLTVVMHELGHLLGFPDINDSADGDLRARSLDLGSRRTPTADIALLANLYFAQRYSFRRI